MKNECLPVRKYTMTDLFPGLEQIMAETESIAHARCGTPRELCQLAEYLAHIRLALTGLQEAGEPSCRTETFTDLLERFSAVEGRIKELRNDLS